MKKIVSAIVAVLCIVAAAFGSGCFGDSSGVKIDASKTQLYVGIYDGGFGADSFDSIADSFEELYKDVSFEEGKTGVEVIIPKGKKEELLQISADSLPLQQYDVFFTTANLYQYVLNNGNGSVIMDISDVVKETTTTWKNFKGVELYGDTKTIEEKMLSSAKAYAQMQDPNYSPDSYKYYGIPFYVATQGIVYDIDLWEEEGFFFSENYRAGVPLGQQTSTDLWTNGKDNSAKKHVGQDGIPNTSDDGLPVFAQDFYNLCNRIATEGLVPLTYSGKQSDYIRDYFVSLYAMYEGYNDFSLNLTYNGTDSDAAIGKVTPQTGYKVFRQEGRKQVLEFAKKLVDNAQTWFYRDDTFGTTSNSETQDHYLQSKYITGTKTIAMMIEGNWWEHEADDTLKTHKDVYKTGDRRFGSMPFPFLPGDTRDKDGNGVLDDDAKNIYVSLQTDTFAFIKSNVSAEKADLAKAFLAYSTTNASMNKYSLNSGTMRPFEYQIDETEGISEFKKYNLNRFQEVLSGEADLVYIKGAEKINMLSGSTMRKDFGFQIEWNNHDLRDPFYAFYNYGSDGLTVDAYYNAFINKFSETYWQANYYSKYY